MSKHYYNAVFSGNGTLQDVICYHSDSENDALVRAARDHEACIFAHSICGAPYMRKVSAREAYALSRLLFGLHKHAHLSDGYKIAFTSTNNASLYTFAASPEIIRG